MTTPKHPALNLFETLLVASPSAREWDLAEIVRGHLEPIGYPFETDGAGNIIVRIEGEDSNAPVVCFAAHMDEIGMVVRKVSASGDLLVGRSGGLLPWKLGEGPVEILGDHQTVTGVLSMGSTHTSGNGSRPIEWDDCWVMTGLSEEQLSEAGVRPGTYALPERARRGPVFFGDPADPLVGAWTFDDRIGVVTLIRLLERLKNNDIKPAVPMLIAFTVSEEVGGHGAKALVQREQPEVFVSVDGSPMPPETDLRLDGRPGIWAKDRLAPYDPRLVKAFMAAAAAANTELQTAVFESAASDASLVSYGTGVQRIACIGHVRENSHGYEVIRLSVLDNLLNTLEFFVRHWARD